MDKDKYRGDDLPPEAPERPGDGECCEGGCEEACVWNKYYAALAAYQQALAAWRERHPQG